MTPAPLARRQTCRDCHTLFTITEEHARWFEGRGLAIPVRCVSCRRSAHEAREIIPARALDAGERQALQQAAAGHVTGSLGQHAVLRTAFRSLGWVVPPSLGAEGMRVLAREALQQ